MLNILMAEVFWFFFFFEPFPKAYFGLIFEIGKGSIRIKKTTQKVSRVHNFLDPSPRMLPNSAHAQAPAGLSSIIITVHICGSNILNVLDNTSPFLKHICTMFKHLFSQFLSACLHCVYWPFFMFRDMFTSCLKTR